MFFLSATFRQVLREVLDSEVLPFGIIGLFAVLLLFHVPRSKKPPMHFHVAIDGFHISSDKVYAQILRTFRDHAIPGIKKTSYIMKTEGGPMTRSRRYLRITHTNGFVLDFSAGPFGKDYFLSLWILERHSLLRVVLEHLPFIGGAIERLYGHTTYYKIDTAIMLDHAFKKAFIAAVDEISEGKATLAIDQSEKPELRDVFNR